jgi:superfamily II DNA or RNA helicase
MGSDEGRNRIAVEHAARYVRQGHQVLVFSLRREHCLRIAQALAAGGIPAGILLGGAGDQKAEFDRTLAQLRSGELRVGVGTVQAVGTGIDLPSVSRGVVAMPIAGNRAQLRQVWGRICRAAAGKDAELAYLYDEHVFPDHFGKLSKASAHPTVWLGGAWVTPAEWRRSLRAPELA